MFEVGKLESIYGKIPIKSSCTKIKMMLTCQMKKYCYAAHISKLVGTMIILNLVYTFIAWLTTLVGKQKYQLAL
jgi:type IV secretory pathway TraG/TraD family ATPase VirD4